MSEYFTRADRRDAIRLSLTRKLRAAGLQEFTPKAIDYAHSRFDAGISAFRAIMEGVKYAHELEKKYLE